MLNAALTKMHFSWSAESEIVHYATKTALRLRVTCYPHLISLQQPTALVPTASDNQISSMNMRQTNSLSPCLRSLLCSQKQKYSKPWSTLDFPNSRRPKEPTSTKGYPTQNTTLPASGSIMQTLSLKGELHSHRCCQQQSIAHSHLMRAEPPHNFFLAQWKNSKTSRSIKLIPRHGHCFAVAHVENRHHKSANICYF